MNVSYYENARSIEPITADAEELFGEIKAGVFKKQIESIRQLKHEGKEYQEEKKKLPGFTPSVRCKGGRSKETIVEYTGVIVIDIDNIKDQLDIVRAIANGLPFVWKAFISPSGSGLKILTKTDATLETHEEAVKQLTEYYSKELDIKIDEGKDLVRLCFMSADSSAYSNPKAEVFKIRKEKGMKVKIQPDNNLTENQLKEKFRQCVQWTNKHYIYAEGSRNQFVFTLACSLNRSGVLKEMALQLILQHYNYNTVEATNCINSAFKNVQEHAKYADVQSQPEPQIIKIGYTDLELVNREVNDLWLATGLLRSTGLGLIGGVQDTGKSNFLRQLCLSITCKKDFFLGYPLTPKYNRCLIVSTEDDINDITVLLKKQLEGMGEQASGNLKIIFAGGLSAEQIMVEMENHIAKYPVDLCVIDCLSDLFDQDMNSNVNVRKLLGTFDYIGRKHGHLTLFCHHLNKSSIGGPVHHKSLTGSGAISQKVRLSMQLTSGEGNEKYFTITKCNYLGRDKKQFSKTLNFSEENFLFTDLRIVINTDDINNSEKRETKQDRLQRLADEIFDKKSLTYTEFVKTHQNINGTSKAQAQRDHASMKELGVIIKDGKNWKLNNSIASAA